MSIRWSPVAFSVFFCIGYVLAFAMNVALVRYYPVSHHWVFGPSPDPHEPGPAITWYGLMASAAAVAVIGAVIMPDRWARQGLRNWLWVCPYAAVAACIYMLRGYFL